MQDAGRGGAGDEDDSIITAADLESSLQDFLASKAPPKASSSSNAQHPIHGLSPWEGIQLPPQFASAPQLPTPAVATSTATVTEIAPEADTAADMELAEEPQQQDTGASGSFGNLPIEFLQDMQTALEGRGYDLSSPDIMQQLAEDPDLAEQLLPLLTASGTSTAVAQERVRQWQQAIQEQMEMEKLLKAKKQRPVWRCAACGRYGCPVAPYIESYQEVDA